MDNMILVLMNSPKGTGKDFIAEYINRELVKCHLIHPADPSRSHVENILGYALTDHVYRVEKELPKELLGGMSIREAMIDYSENYMKFVYGNQIFSKIMYNKMVALKSMEGSYSINTPFICTSIGFNEEVDFFVNKLRPENMLIVNLERYGATFEGDSRYHVNIPTDVYAMRIKNEADPYSAAQPIAEWINNRQNSQ